MKLLTKEQEAAHYNATLQGGLLGGATGLAIGSAGLFAATRRYAFVRTLTLPFRAFMVTSAGTFGGIIAADHASHAYEKSQNPIDQEFQTRAREKAARDNEGKTFTQRAMDFGRKERYKIVGASWIASMAIAFSVVNRNKYLTGQQKLVQARVYAQFLTVGVLIATAAFEIADSKNETGRYETVKVIDPNDPEHKRYIEKQRPVEQSDGDTLWKDMIAAEEERLKERESDEKKYRSEHEKKHPHHKKGSDKKDEKKSDGQDDKKNHKQANEQVDKKDVKHADKKDQEKDEGKDEKDSKNDSKNDKQKEKVTADEDKGDEASQKKVPGATDAKNKKDQK